MKKTINQLKKFFKRRGMNIYIRPLKNTKDEFTHCIMYLSSNSKKNIQQFMHTVECVFAHHDKLRDDCYEIAINADFVICRECGCSDNNACLGGCYWVQPDLCSSCAPDELTDTAKAEVAAHQHTQKTQPASKLHKLLED